MGLSGCGKSTLLQCAAGLDKPTAGRLLLGDVLLEEMVDPVEVREVEPRQGLRQACGEVVYLGASNLSVGVAAGKQHRCVCGELGGDRSGVVAGDRRELKQRGGDPRWPCFTRPRPAAAAKIIPRMARIMATRPLGPDMTGHPPVAAGHLAATP